MQHEGERVKFYPVVISPRAKKPVWEVDYRVRTLASLPSIHPPTDYRWSQTGRGKKVEKPVAIIHRTCFFGFRHGYVAEDYQRMIHVSDFFGFGLGVLGIGEDRDLALKHEDIARLKQLDKEGSRQALTQVHKSILSILPGEAIKISDDYKEGALTDWSGILLGFDEERAKVEGRMLGAVREMSVPAWAIRRA